MNDRLTNRWTPAKTNAAFTYDAVGNLTDIAYAVSPAIHLKYDALNRLTNMLDAAGTTAYGFTSVGLLQSEDGPWNNDTVTYSYANRLRSGLSLAQPNASPWILSYGYDAASRLQSINAPEGAYSYVYKGAGKLVQKLVLPNSAYITNSFDSEARLLATVLKNSSDSVLNSHSYGYNLANQRTGLTNTAGNYLNFGYDALGQVKTALGYESNGIPRMHEQFGYAYDPANNLSFRTNNALLQTFTVNNLNELSTNTRSGTLTVAGTTTSPATNVTVSDNGNAAVAAVRYTNDNTFARTNVAMLDGTNSFTAIANDNYGRTDTTLSTTYQPATVTFRYDANGNLLFDGNRGFDYDDENELIRVTVTNSFKSEFTYDGKMRRRIRKEYLWQSGIWILQSETRYVYDGNVVIQERDGLNLPTVAYTRGNDLSGSLQGAGGIGGLLAFSDLKSSISNPSHYFYFADGNGNVTMLINSNQLAVAKYLYEPFGSLVSAAGPVADLNRFRFSSKEHQSGSGLYYFERRFYDPLLQRWLNRDPVGENGGLNLYAYVGNNPVNQIDPLGLDGEATLAAEPTLLMDEEELAAYRAAKAAKEAKKAADACKKAKEAADRAKEIKKVRDAENAIDTKGTGEESGKN